MSESVTIDEDSIYSIVWEEFDSFLDKEGYQPTKFHLPLDEKEGIPYCYEVINKEYEFKKRPSGAYPTGYRDVCRDCLKFWGELDD